MTFLERNTRCRHCIVKHFFIAIFTLLILLSACGESFCWWSWSPPGEHSTHHKISDGANSLVAQTISNNFLKSTGWVGATYTITNDNAAHGNIPERNGGDIALFFKSFLDSLNNGNTATANRYLGYCQHLLADAHVPAHAFNIKHSGLDTGMPDQFEYEARDMSPTVSSLVNSSIDHQHVLDPVSYYMEALGATRANVAGAGFSAYYHSGDRGGEYANWNGDGPKGYYTVELGIPYEILDYDLFPNSSTTGRTFVQQQLDEATKTSARFLLAVDRLISYSPSISRVVATEPSSSVIAVTGSGYVPYGTATIRIINPDGTEYSARTVSIDANGGYSVADLAIHNLIDGRYIIQAQDVANGKKSNAINLDIPFPVPLNGICGSNHGGYFTSPPAANLCQVGSASQVTGTGPWSWECSGSDGGTTVSCTANIQSATSVVRDGIVIGGGKTAPDITDAVAVFLHVTGNAGLSAAQLQHADVAPLGIDGKPVGNGVVDSADVIMILRRVVGIGSW